MSKKIAFLFPGQGSQSVGMGKDLYDSFSSAKEIFDSADKVLNKSITNLCFEGPEDALKQTINTQPAIVTMSIAALEVLKSNLGISPDYVAGHSLGEYCAMYCAGVMDLENTLNAIQKRAELMGKTTSVPVGSMSAILNPPEKEIFSKCLEEASEFGYVDVANYNSPAQVVLTGEYDAVSKAGELMLANGARRAVVLPVSGAFHSKLMRDAAKEFENFVPSLTLNNAKIPVITNVDAKETYSSKDFAVKMPQQIYSPVHWTHTIQRMADNGVELFVEIGPGKVLAGLNKKIVPDAIVLNIFDKESLENTLSALKKEFAIV